MTDEEYKEKYGKYGTERFFEEGAWEIHGNPLRHKTMNPAVSRVVHYCEVPRTSYRDSQRSWAQEYYHVWANLNGSRVCSTCGETMPDSVQTLWTLQNFDIDFSRFNTPPALSPLKVTK